MNYITVQLIKMETLYCSCGHYFLNEAMYLIDYKENSWETAHVRCKKCLHKEMQKEKS